MVPWLRAETINNIGLVFWSAGEAVREPRHFRQALRIIGLAEAMVSRDETPIAWANTRNSAGAAHWSLGNETGELEDIRRAVSAFEDAREVYGRLSGGSAQHLRAERNLGNAKISLGLETGDRETIASGLEHLRAAVDGVCDDLAAYAPAECVELLFDLGLSEIRASKLRGASSERTRAKATLRRAKAAAEKYGMPRHAAAIGRVLDEACVQRRPAKHRVRARRGEASKEARRGGVRP